MSFYNTENENKQSDKLELFGIAAVVVCLLGASCVVEFAPSHFPPPIDPGIRKSSPAYPKGTVESPSTNPCEPG